VRGSVERQERAVGSLKEYADVQTFTVQPAFKYDHPVSEVSTAIDKLRSSEMRTPEEIDEERCLQIVDKVSANYHYVIEHLAPLINDVASFVPKKKNAKTSCWTIRLCQECR
jgi:phosphoenolpyruvate carboxylase